MLILLARCPTHWWPHTALIVTKFSGDLPQERADIRYNTEMSLGFQIWGGLIVLDSCMFLFLSYFLKPKIPGGLRPIPDSDISEIELKKKKSQQ